MELDRNLIAEIIQLREDSVSIKECIEFTNGASYISDMKESGNIEKEIENVKKNGMIISTSEGESTIHIGDYIVKYINGDVHTCSKEEFEQDNNTTDGRLD